MGINSKFYRTTVCSICGKRFLSYRLNANNKMVKKSDHGLCPDCQVWRNLIDNKPKELEVVAGVAYKVYPKSENLWGVHLGGNGAIRYILKKDFTTIESNDVWKIGEVPFKFRDELPDTGWWIKNPKIVKRLARKRICKAPMCYDRYRCLWFDYTAEFTELGPFDRIPTEHKVGSERCSRFVDILDIEHYDQFINPEDMLSDEAKSR